MNHRSETLLRSANWFAASALALTLASLPEPGLAAERAMPAEKNPPGDIPDTQVFIDYASSEGFTMKVPEGWARTDRPDGTSFVDKLDGVVLTVAKASSPPTVETARKTYVPELEKAERAVKVSAIRPVKLPAGPAIRIVYTSNSEPNQVTNKQVRLENERYLYFKDGILAQWGLPTRQDFPELILPKQ